MRKRNVAERLFESNSNGIEVSLSTIGAVSSSSKDAAQSLKNENPFIDPLPSTERTGLPIGWILYISRDGQLLVYEAC